MSLEQYVSLSEALIKNKSVKSFKAPSKQQRLNQTAEDDPAFDNPTFKQYRIPFTETSYYMYLSNFLRGLDLESLIKGSDICIKNVVFSTDEFIYFTNNASDFTSKEWYLPVMNFTRTLASNFSDGVVNCYEFSNSTYYFFIVRFAQ